MDNLKLYNRNEKSKFIIKYLKENLNDMKINTIKIVTSNTNSNDLYLLIDTVKGILPDSQIEITDFKSNINIQNDLIIYFGFFPCNKNIFFKKFSEKQLVLLSEHEYVYYKNLFYYLKRDLNSICSTKERKKSLCIEDQNSELFNNIFFQDPYFNLSLSDFIINEEHSEEIEELVENKEDENDKKIVEVDNLGNIIEDLINSTNKINFSGVDLRKIVKPEQDKTIYFIFDDGTVEGFNTEKNFYKFDENWIEDSEEEIILTKLNALDVKEGDHLAIFKTEIDFRSFIDSKIHDNSELKNILETSEMWRKNLKILYTRLTYSLPTTFEVQEKISLLLKKYGNVEIGSQSIKKWYDGDTTLPFQLNKIIDGLNNIKDKENITSMYFIENIDNAVECSKKIKNIRINISRLLRKKAVNRINNITNPNDDYYMNDLINKITDEIKIKKVDRIISSKLWSKKNVVNTY